MLQGGGTPRTGAQRNEYMVMWTAVLEGADGMGDFDAAYFAGPQDFARFFGFDGTNDMRKLDAFFDKRVVSDPDFAKAAQGGLTKSAFRRYYALRASAAVSRGAHDEWNIFRLVNDKRRADTKIGTPDRDRVRWRECSPPQHEATVRMATWGSARCERKAWSLNPLFGVLIPPAEAMRVEMPAFHRASPHWSRWQDPWSDCHC